MKRWYDIKAAANGKDTAEVSIFDVIDPYWGLSAKNFIADFRAATKDAKVVDVLINSPGGSVMDGNAIYNTLKASGKTINVKVLGVAASIASVIAMAGDTIEMPANSMMMIHNASGGGWGTADELRDTADVLDKIDGQIVSTYANRTGKPEDEIRALMKAETYMTAAEAVELGFATAVTEDITATALFSLDDLPSNVRAIFKAPEASKPEPTFVAQLRGLADQAGLGDFATAFAGDPTLTTIEAVQAAIADAREIKDLGAMFEQPEAAAALITGRKSLPEARKELASLKAANDPPINTAPREGKPKAAGDDINPTALWARIRAMNSNRSKQ